MVLEGKISWVMNSHLGQMVHITLIHKSMKEGFVSLAPWISQIMHKCELITQLGSTLGIIGKPLSLMFF
jgi:hypothetical protein